jgi:hypothetical protein
MKTKSLMLILTWLCLPSLAQTPKCEEWQNKLQTEIRAAHQCDTKHQACLVKAYGNPMRELDYCKKIFKTCESLDAKPEDGSLPKDLADYKKQCQG